MFCVVEFTEEKSVEVVPDNWIDEKTICVGGLRGKPSQKK